jgi:hypothetical protein
VIALVSVMVTIFLAIMGFTRNYEGRLTRTETKVENIECTLATMSTDVREIRKVLVAHQDDNQ